MRTRAVNPHEIAYPNHLPRMSSLRTIGRYWHSLRHLRPHQIYGRVLFDRVMPRPDLRPAPALRPVTGVWHAPASRAQSLIGPTTFRLLNVQHDLDAVGWDGGTIDLLWRYNQHYFDDLAAVGAADRRDWHAALLLCWVHENPPAQGTGWRPYPNSLRIVNWVKWALAGGQLPQECLQSLAVQARWQRRRIEWHYLGNHLLVNAKALVFAGCLFDGPEADEWRTTGLDIYARQLPEQILADGGHYELSPMYQSLMLEDLLDIINLASAYPALARDVPSVIRESILPMRRWLAAMCHPDGQISFFNDAAFGIAPEPASIDSYAARLDFPEYVRPLEGITHLAPSGYVRMQRGPAVVIADVGQVCADVCPAHAHADTLSFECSLYGKRVLVNTGVLQYGQGLVRDQQRGTPAHNAVSVDGMNSSDVWGGFRVAHRARVHGVSIQDTGKTLELRASHDGYRRLPASPVHERRWQLGDGELVVTDRVTGGLQAMAHVHFAPGVVDDIQGHADTTEERGRDASGVNSLLGGRASVALGPTFSIGSFDWCPEFGRTTPATRAEIPLQGGAATMRLSWADSALQ